MKLIKLYNAFHGTSVMARAATVATFIDPPNWPTRAQKRAAKRIRDRLCGVAGCTCGVIR